MLPPCFRCHSEGLTTQPGIPYRVTIYVAECISCTWREHVFIHFRYEYHHPRFVLYLCTNYRSQNLGNPIFWETVFFESFTRTRTPPPNPTSSFPSRTFGKSRMPGLTKNYRTRTNHIDVLAACIYASIFQQGIKAILLILFLTMRIAKRGDESMRACRQSHQILVRGNTCKLR